MDTFSKTSYMLLPSSSPQDPVVTLLGTSLSPKRKDWNQLAACRSSRCCVRRELQGRRSDRKHSGSWILDLPPEPTVAMTAAHTFLLQAENQNLREEPYHQDLLKICLKMWGMTNILLLAGCYPRFHTKGKGKKNKKWKGWCSCTLTQ